MATRYRVYGGDSSGGPVDESTWLVTGLTSLSWSPPALAAPSHTKYILRAYDTVSGLAEKTVDSLLEIVIDATGADVTGRPAPPDGLLVTPIANGGLRVEWTHPQIHLDALPIGFRVYKGTGGVVNYGSVVATVVYLGPFAHRVDVTSGLTSGTAYTVGVRAYNLAGEEENTATATAIPTTAAPADVTGLGSSLVN
jgi:hypothetical protein